MPQKCIACGMPMTQASDFANGDSSKDYCKHCARPDGSMKSRDEVLEGMTAFIVRTQGFDPAAARKTAETAMRDLPAWKKARI